MHTFENLETLSASVGMQMYAGMLSSQGTVQVNTQHLSSRVAGAPAMTAMHVLGLSVAAVLRLEGRRLWLGGVDIVDGSPGMLSSTRLAQCSAVPGSIDYVQKCTEPAASMRLAAWSM